MMRQLLLRVLYFLGATLFICNFALAKPPNDNTLVIPSPKDEKIEMKTQPKTHVLEKHDFLIEKTTPMPPATPTYHLKPGPSLTLALSRAYDITDEDHSGWIGVHVAPWMNATMRGQLGLDLHSDLGWISAALHSLPTRNLYRLYYGGGVSLLFDSHDELRPLLRLRNYYAFATGGWELQLLHNQNVRVEVSFHQGTEKSLVKATLGYTFLF